MPITQRGVLMRTICWIAVFLIIFQSFGPSTAPASEEASGMVYVSNELRDSIFEATQSEESYDSYLALQKDGLRIVKESITPVYTASMLDYAKTGNLSVVPREYKNVREDIMLGQIYIAKTVLADGTYGGNLKFSYKEGEAHFVSYSPSEAMRETFDNPSFDASSSYADHAIRIKRMLGRNSFVSPNDVIFLEISYGQFFYIRTNGQQYFVPIGLQKTADTIVRNEYTDRLLTLSDMKELAQEQLEIHNNYLLELEAWKKEHPGEGSPIGLNDFVSPVVSYGSQVDNIIDIAEYLGIDMTAKPQAAVVPQDEPILHSQNTLWMIIPVCVIGTGCIAVVWTKKRKKAKTIAE